MITNKKYISNYIIIDAHSSKLDYLYDSFTNNKEFNDSYAVYESKYSL